MIYERFPSEFSGSQLTAAKRIAVSRADHVLCISESTRRDLIEIFGIDAGRVSVVYLGYDKLPLSALTSTEPRIQLDLSPFLLQIE